MSEKDQEIIKQDPYEFFTSVAWRLVYPIRDWENGTGYKQKGIPLTEEGKEIIERAINAPLNIKKIIPFLIQKCNIPESSLIKLEWVDIVEACRVFLSKEKTENPTPTKTTQRKNPYEKKGVNGRMLEEITKDQSCHGWTCTQWAKYLDCSKPSVTATTTWKDLAKIRETQKAEKALDRHRR